jgi:hypothetical protein
MDQPESFSQAALPEMLLQARCPSALDPVINSLVTSALSPVPLLVYPLPADLYPSNLAPDPSAALCRSLLVLERLEREVQYCCSPAMAPLTEARWLSPAARQPQIGTPQAE